MNHTPTPWELASNERHVLDSEKLIVVYPGGSRSEVTAKANAQFIVAACNAHEELVKIAQAYRNYLKRAAHTDGEVATYHHIEDVLNTIEKGTQHHE